MKITDNKNPCGLDIKYYNLKHFDKSRTLFIRSHSEQALLPLMEGGHKALHICKCCMFVQIK